jgi:flagellar motor protein MotB
MVKGNRDSEFSINFWPSFADICFIMLLILILVLFIVLVSNTEAFTLNTIRNKQNRIEELIRMDLNRDALKDIKFKNDFKIQYITFNDRILFRQGEAELQSQGITLLNSVGRVLKENRKLYAEIRVEGHTDKIPIPTCKGRFKSNWELSSARATAVVKYFDEVIGMDPYEIPMSAVGFSEYRPVDTGDTSQALARNRRIEMAIYYNAN